MNKKIIEDFFKTIDFNKEKATDLDTLMNYYAEDAIFQFASNPTLKGKGAIREALSGITSQFAEIEHVLHRFVIEGDLIALEATAKFKLPDGKAIDWPFADVFELKAGKITYHRVYADMATLGG